MERTPLFEKVGGNMSLVLEPAQICVFVGGESSGRWTGMECIYEETGFGCVSFFNKRYRLSGEYLN